MLQSYVADEFRGRLMSVYSMISVGLSQVFGAFAAGAVASAVGVDWAIGAVRRSCSVRDVRVQAREQLDRRRALDVATSREVLSRDFHDDVGCPFDAEPLGVHAQVVVLRCVP